MMFEPKTFQSKYFHNNHSERRDAFLTEMFGEEWLRDMKAKGYFGGDWCPTMVGTEKPEGAKSGYIDTEGNFRVAGEEIDLDGSNTST